MITIDHVTFQYKDSERPALQDITLQIEDGEFVGIIGTAGAGKSTLAMSLGAIIPHEMKGDFYGAIQINGKDTVDHPMDAFCHEIGQVFQDIDSQMVASVVEDEILFGLENFGVPREEIGARLEKVLNELGIADLRTRQIASLSGGQKQKVAIASILALEPGIIVLDEPTGELDPESTEEIFSLLQKLNQEKGITIVIIEQKIKLLCEYVKRLIVLDKGEIQFDSVPRDVIAHIDTFKTLGINVPPVAELSALLQAEGLYAGQTVLTVDEGESMVREVLHDSI